MRAGLSGTMPAASEAAATALGAMSSPRPRGWSGCVITPTTRRRGPCAASRRVRICAASGGVPMKTIRSGAAAAASDLDAGGPLLIGFALLDQLGEPAAVKLALDAAQAIDEEAAVEMIDLVLQRDRQQILSLDLDRLLLRRPRAHHHLFRALHLGGEIDHREAALLPEHRALGLDDLGIDELEQVLAGVLVIGIEHDHAARIADLRRRQADAGRGIHGLDHALDEAVEPAVDFGDRQRALLERGIGKLANPQQSHRDA